MTFTKPPTGVSFNADILLTVINSASLCSLSNSNPILVVKESLHISGLKSPCGSELSPRYSCANTS